MKTRLAALALASLALACADNAASIRPSAICSPPETCEFGPTCDAQFIGQLVLDTSLSQILWLYVQVDNQLPDNADLSAGRVNTNDAWVTEYEVEYEGAATGSSMGRVASSEVPASGSSVIKVGLQPPAVPGGVLAKLRIKGKYADQSSFETAEFEIPISICQGCLGFPACPAGETLKSVCPPTAGQMPLTVSCEAATTTAPTVP